MVKVKEGIVFGVLDYLVDFVGIEINCFVCLEVFDDFKCFFKCVYNVCVICFGNLVRWICKKSMVECFECCIKLMVLLFGVIGFFINYLLKWFVENFFEYRGRCVFDKVFECYRE